MGYIYPISFKRYPATTSKHVRYHRNFQYIAVLCTFNSEFEAPEFKAIFFCVDGLVSISQKLVWWFEKELKKDDLIDWFTYHGHSGSSIAAPALLDCIIRYNLHDTTYPSYTDCLFLLASLQVEVNIDCSFKQIPIFSQLV